MTEPIDQATKDLIEKEAKDIADKKWFFKENADRAFKTGYIAGATVWAEKLKQERALIKELVDGLKDIEINHPQPFHIQNKIESLIQKAKDKSHE